MMDAQITTLPDPDQPGSLWPSDRDKGMRRAYIEDYARQREPLGLVMQDVEDAQPEYLRRKAA